MFFRKILSSDHDKILAQHWIVSFENGYLVENQDQIIGVCTVKNNIISDFYVVDSSYKVLFLEMIEEFFFMGTDILESTDESFLEYGWFKQDNRIIKTKIPRNPYTMVIE